MRKPKDIRECIHYWSAMALPEAKCGNVRYDGPVIYSYAEPIGLLLPGNRVLISSRNFSVTTSSHQTQARMATHHMRSCSAPHLTKYHSSDLHLQGMHKENFRHWMRDAEYAVTELKNHPRRKIRIANRLTSILQSYNAYREFFELDWPELSSDEMRALVEETAQRRHEEQLAAEKRREEQRRIDEAEEATELLLWRDHVTERRAFSKMALRLSLDGTEIETTRGAAVPVTEAPVLWRYTSLCRRKGEAFTPDSEVKVGHYKLTRIEQDGTLVIGCHTIPFYELELMAKKLKFIEGDSNGFESDRIGHDADICSASGKANNGECCTAA
jgi:hypothetical protein